MEEPVLKNISYVKSNQSLDLRLPRNTNIGHVKLGIKYFPTNRSSDFSRVNADTMFDDLKTKGRVQDILFRQLSMAEATLIYGGHFLEKVSVRLLKHAEKCMM